MIERGFANIALIIVTAWNILCWVSLVFNTWALVEAIGDYRWLQIASVRAGRLVFFVTHHVRTCAIRLFVSLLLLSTSVVALRILQITDLDRVRTYVGILAMLLLFVQASLFLNTYFDRWVRQVLIQSKNPDVVDNTHL